MQLKNRINFVFVACFILAALTLGVQAQDQDDLVFAAVQNGQPTVFGIGETPLVIDTTPNTAISSLVWSRDGNLLAYIMYDQDFQAHVYVADVTGTAPVMLNTGVLVPGFPIIFSADGQLIYVAESEIGTDSMPTTQVDAGSPYHADVRQIAPVADAQPERLATFGYSIGCVNSQSTPLTWPYWEEAGYAGSALILKMTDYGLLHSANCSGFGLALLNLQTGKHTLIGPQYMFTDQQPSDGPLSRAVLSPDGKTAAAVRTFFTGTEAGLPLNYGLVFIDLATLTITQIATEAQPDQLTWSNEGTTLFYSVQENPVNIAGSLTSEQLATLAPLTGYESDGQTLRVLTYTTSIHQLNPTTGEDTLVYSADAFAIGRMAVTTDGQYLFASQVASPERWMAALGGQEANLAPVTLYRIPLITREAPIVIGENLTQFTLRPTRQ